MSERCQTTKWATHCEGGTKTNVLDCTHPHTHTQNKKYNLSAKRSDVKKKKTENENYPREKERKTLRLQLQEKCLEILDDFMKIYINEGRTLLIYNGKCIFVHVFK